MDASEGECIGGELSEAAELLREAGAMMLEAAGMMRAAFERDPPPKTEHD